MKTSSSNNTDEAINNGSNSNELVEKREIENTPFTAVRLEEKWFLTMGKYRLTEPVNTYQEIEAEINNTTWDRIIQIIMIVVREELQQTKSETPAKNEK